jgi:hypothetical protein
MSLITEPALLEVPLLQRAFEPRSGDAWRRGRQLVIVRTVTPELIEYDCYCNEVWHEQRSCSVHRWPALVTLMFKCGVVFTPGGHV